MVKKFFPLIRKSIYIVVLFVILIVLIALKNNPDVCEAMSRGLARVYGRVMTFLSGLIPFLSLTEVFFVSLILLIIFLLVISIIAFVKRKLFRGLSHLMTIPCVILLTVTVYTFSCELAYNRKEMPLPYYETEVAREDFVPIYNYFADDLNNCIAQLSFKENGDLENRSLNEITKEVKKAYQIVNDNYFNPYFGSVKPMLSSFIYREFQITGVTFSPFGEANINTMNTNAGIPLTVAHELAHTRGVMREDDANKLAFYVCLNSEDPYLRYSAYVSYFYQLRNIASSSYLTAEELALCHQIDSAYNKTNSYIYKYWQEHDLLEKFADFVNNLYIKSSGVQEGTDSYSGGTSYEFDPVTNKLHPSSYQKLFFEKYYRS